jgi:tetratricopeptide (TPR) repeat protein
MSHDALRLSMDGCLEEAIELGQKIYAQGKEMGVPLSAGVMFRLGSTRPVLYTGKAGEQIPGFAYPDEENSIGAWAHRSLLLAHQKRYAEVVGLLEVQVMSRQQKEPFAPCWRLLAFLEAAVLAGHFPAVNFLYNLISDTGFVTTGAYYLTCISRHLGFAAAFLGRYDASRNHYQKALEITTQMRFRPELALTHLQNAELLLEHFPREKAEALAHLDAAIPELRDMKMKPFLEKALQLKTK